MSAFPREARGTLTLLSQVLSQLGSWTGGSDGGQRVRRPELSEPGAQVLGRAVPTLGCRRSRTVAQNDPHGGHQLPDNERSRKDYDECNECNDDCKWLESGV